jgi:hypothetical protein
MVVKTFRGLLANEEQDHIRLQTNNGETGYRIIKLQILPSNPGGASYEACVKVFKSKQTTTPTTTVDFSDSDLLAAAIFAASSSTGDQYSTPSVVFDNEIFNQDIYVTQKDTQGNSMSYYIELEVIALSEQAAEFTTLKDIRSRNTT